jgi:hypothetical protein
MDLTNKRGLKSSSIPSDSTMCVRHVISRLEDEAKPVLLELARLGRDLYTLNAESVAFWPPGPGRQ